MDLLLVSRLNPDLSLSDRVSVNLLIADMSTSSSSAIISIAIFHSNWFFWGFVYSGRPIFEASPPHTPFFHSSITNLLDNLLSSSGLLGVSSIQRGLTKVTLILHTS